MDQARIRQMSTCALLWPKRRDVGVLWLSIGRPRPPNRTYSFEQQRTFLEAPSASRTVPILWSPVTLTAFSGSLWPRTAFTLLQMAHQLDVDPRYHLTRHSVGTSLLSMFLSSLRRRGFWYLMNWAVYDYHLSGQAILSLVTWHVFSDVSTKINPLFWQTAPDSTRRYHHFFKAVKYLTFLSGTFHSRWGVTVIPRLHRCDLLGISFCDSVWQGAVKG